MPDPIRRNRSSWAVWNARLPRVVATLTLAVLASACGTSEPSVELSATDSAAVSSDAPEPPPWSQPPLAWDSVPPVYRDAWEAAENRETCAALAPARPLSGGIATVRTAEFGGGWGVAYGLPEQRSAFGVAGTGASAEGAIYEGFPNRLEWADGSSARYGLEGGTGPNYLAYLVVPGQECLYNVWSAVGEDHLEELLGLLRFVR
ncbi:MAG: hypothetical protein WD766_04040 [Gemmatimonadota bacterium]